MMGLGLVAIKHKFGNSCLCMIDLCLNADSHNVMECNVEIWNLFLCCVDPIIVNPVEPHGPFRLYIRMVVPLPRIFMELSN